MMKTLMLFGGAVLFVGCQRTQPPRADRVNDTPLVIDEAMQKRDWEPATEH